MHTVSLKGPSISLQFRRQLWGHYSVPIALDKFEHLTIAHNVQPHLQRHSRSTITCSGMFLATASSMLLILRCTWCALARATDSAIFDFVTSHICTNANFFSYKQAPWVSHEIPDISDQPLVQREHITVRSRWPVCLDIRSNLFIYREEARLRSRPTACQHPYWRQAYPSRPNSRRQQEISCSPSRIRQFLMGI